MKKIIQLNKFEKILQILIFIFPLIFVLRSAALNLVLFIIGLIGTYIILKQKKLEFFNYTIVKYLILFFSFIFLNSLINFHDAETLIKSFGNFRFLFLTFAVFYILIKSSKNIIKRFIYLNFILLILISLDIFYQFNSGKNILGFLPGMCNNQLQCLRFSGMFGSELIAGAYLCQIGLLMFFLSKNLINYKKNTKFKIIEVMIPIFLFLTILITGERNALLIFVLTFIIIFIFHDNKFKNFLKYIPFYLIVFLIILQSSFSIKARYVTNILDIVGLGDRDEKILINKIKQNPWSYHYQAALELFFEKPLLGHGYKSFRYKCKETKIDIETINNKEKYRNLRACSTHPHSLLFEFLSENGLIGVIFYLGFIIIIFSLMIKSRKDLFNKDNISILYFGSLLLAILFPLKPSGSFFSTFNSSMTFYILGFFMYYIHVIKKV